MGDFTIGQWLVLLQHELLLFAGVFFLLGALDEIGIDLLWIWLKLSGRSKTPVLQQEKNQAPLHGPAAVFIPAWN